MQPELGAGMLKFHRVENQIMTAVRYYRILCGIATFTLPAGMEACLRDFLSLAISGLELVPGKSLVIVPSDDSERRTNSSLLLNEIYSVCRALREAEQNHCNGKLKYSCRRNVCISARSTDFSATCVLSRSSGTKSKSVIMDIYDQRPRLVNLTR